MSTPAERSETSSTEISAAVRQVRRGWWKSELWLADLYPDLCGGNDSARKARGVTKEFSMIQLMSQKTAHTVLSKRYPVDPPPLAVFSEYADAIYEEMLVAD
jgi:hypothetical protein